MNYEELRKRLNERNAFSNLIGMEITEITAGSAKSRMPITADHLNPMGSVHGGALATLADVTGGAAAGSDGRQVTTLDADLHYLRPGLNTTCLYGSCREIKRGARVLVYDVSIADQDGRVLAEGIYSYMYL